jgi:SAM-dependent methyltransferase
MAVWMPHFVCPECSGELLNRVPEVPGVPGVPGVPEVPEVPEVPGVPGVQRFVCVGCELTFERRGLVYEFLTAARAEQAVGFHEQYRAIRRREGYGSTSVEYYRALPRVRGSSAQAGQWRVRYESYAHLRRCLFPPPAGQPRLRVVDIGAGNAWLSNRLALDGHDAVAVDRLADDVDGLGAIRHYGVPLIAVQADFDALPFAPGQFDVAVFNGSLHYSKEPAATLAAARRVLKPGGVVAVMDSPMFQAEDEGHAMLVDQAERFRQLHGLDAATRPGVGFLTYDMLDRAAAALGVAGRFIKTRGPLIWRVRRQLSLLRLGRPPAAFGVWVAQ